MTKDTEQTANACREAFNAWYGTHGRSQARRHSSWLGWQAAWTARTAQPAADLRAVSDKLLTEVRQLRNSAPNECFGVLNHAIEIIKDALFTPQAAPVEEKNKIAAGLEDAIAFIKGDSSKGRITRINPAQPGKADVVDIDALCLKHVNAARSKHEMGPLASLMKASGTELLWACRRLARETVALPPADTGLVEELSDKTRNMMMAHLDGVYRFSARENCDALLDTIFSAALARCAAVKELAEALERIASPLAPCPDDEDSTPTYTKVVDDYTKRVAIARSTLARYKAAKGDV